jgi:hypothetical protein
VPGTETSRRPDLCGRSAASGSGQVAILPPLEQGVAVLGRRPVPAFVDDQGDGVDAIVCGSARAGLGGGKVGPVAAVGEAGGSAPCGAHPHCRQPGGGGGLGED